MDLPAVLRLLKLVLVKSNNTQQVSNENTIGTPDKYKKTLLYSCPQFILCMNNTTYT